MSRRSLIASFAVIAGSVLAASPAGAATAIVCPPGVTDASYCASVNESGLSSAHTASSSNDSIVKYTVKCAPGSGCAGKLLFETVTGGTSARGHVATSVIYGSTAYSIAAGKTAKLTVHLTTVGRRALERTGKFTATVVSVTNGIRSVVGHVTVKGRKTKTTKKAVRHTTHTQSSPAFTG
jgi:hypothetical protein